MGVDDLIADFVQATPPLNPGAKRDAQDACGMAILPETRLVSELQAYVLRVSELEVPVDEIVLLQTA
jgi:hypothetical protein